MDQINYCVIIVSNLPTISAEDQGFTIYPTSLPCEDTLFEFCPTLAETENSVIPENTYIRARHYASQMWVRATKDVIDVTDIPPVMSKVCLRQTN